MKHGGFRKEIKQIFYFVTQISSNCVYFIVISVAHVHLGYASNYQIKGFRNVSEIISSDISFP